MGKIEKLGATFWKQVVWVKNLQKVRTPPSASARDSMNFVPLAIIKYLEKDPASQNPL